MTAVSPEVYGLIGGLEIEEDSSDGIRAGFKAFVEAINGQGDVAEVGRVTDDHIAAGDRRIPLRLYEPLGSTPESTKDVVVYFHGGGFMAGDLDTADAGARALAAGLRTRLVSVDYRLAPEHPFPAAFDDCLVALRAVYERTETRSVVVAGESAGGNLAAAVAMAARDLEMPLLGQVLVNPVLDASFETESYREFGEAYGLTANHMRLYMEWYAGDRDVFDPRISPLRADDLAGLAPVVVTTPASIRCATKALPTRGGSSKPTFRLSTSRCPR